jgi:putative ABC transport system substrate-binding protein
MSSKITKLVFLTLILASLGSLYFLKKETSHTNLPIIAMTQIISHNTLDEVRGGLIEGLEEAGLKDDKTIHIIYENANGNVSVASQIAQRLVSSRPSVLVALSTQSAQILKPLAQKEHIPLVFTAVTDPISAHLIQDWSKTDEGVTGISDYMAPEPQLEMILSFLPNLKKLGLLNNPAEINSVSLLDQFESVAKQRGIEILRAPAHNTAEAAEAFKSLIGKVDAVFFPNDNTIMAAAPAIAALARHHKVPLFANDEASVKQGVLSALSFDRIAMGKETAKIIVGILKGKSPQDFKTHNTIPIDLVVNEATLKILGLEMPRTFKEKIKLVP